MAAEALRQGVTGVAADIVASTIAPWGFDPKAVEVPVALWYGQEDALVPPDHGAWWAGVLPTSTLTVVPGAGHLLPLLAWKQILASVK
jgi:pimeloyl-ACP methyl ester carboxylesterase